MERFYERLLAEETEKRRGQMDTLQRKLARLREGAAVEEGQKATEAKSKEQEPARQKAIGRISGGKVQQLEERGYEVVYGKATEAERWEMIGILSGGNAEKLIEAGITIKRKEEPREIKKAGAGPEKPKTSEEPAETPAPAPAPAENHWLRNPDTGKIELYFSKAQWDTLDAKLKQMVKVRFLWAPSKKAWVSKATKDMFWPDQIVKRLTAAGIFKEETKAKPVPGRPGIDLSELKFVPADRAKNDVTIETDVWSLEKSWALEPEFYVGMGGRGEIAGRAEKFKEFLKTGQPIEQPEISLNADGRPRFINGSHRFAVLRDLGLKVIPVSVPTARAEDFRAAFGTGEMTREEAAEPEAKAETPDIEAEAANLTKEDLDEMLDEAFEEKAKGEKAAAPAAQGDLRAYSPDLIQKPSAKDIGIQQKDPLMRRALIAGREDAWTNGYFLDLTEPPYKTEGRLSETKPDATELWKEAVEKSINPMGEPLAFLPAMKDTPASVDTVIFSSSGSGHPLGMDLIYFSYFKSKYPDAEFFYGKDNKAGRHTYPAPVLVKSKGEPVGIVMPILKSTMRESHLDPFKGEKAFTPAKDWETNLMKARQYANALKVPHVGVKLPELVADIKAKLAAPGPVAPGPIAATRPLSQILKEVGERGVKGVDEALKGLHELFGGGSLKSFPGGFNSETYAKAKPHFEASFQAFKEAGLGLKEFLSEMRKQLGAGDQTLPPPLHARKRWAGRRRRPRGKRRSPRREPRAPAARAAS